jgi:hypothetical protein
MGNDLSIGYRGQDMPISIGTAFLNRVQDAEFSRTIPTTPVDEMGTANHVGMIQGVYQYTCRLQRIGIEDGIETSLSGETTPVTLQDFRDAAGVTVKGPNGGITAAKVTQIVFEATAGNEPARETWSLEGTGWTSGSVASASDTTAIPGGADCTLAISGVKSRVQRVRITCDLRREAAMEIGDANPIGYAYDPATVQAEVEVMHSTVTDELWAPSQVAPDDLVLTINNKVITLVEAVSEGQVGRGNVRGWATSIYRFNSKSGECSIAWT